MTLRLLLLVLALAACGDRSVTLRQADSSWQRLEALERRIEALEQPRRRAPPSPMPGADSTAGARP